MTSRRATTLMVGNTWEKSRLSRTSNRPRWDRTLIAFPDAVSAGDYLWDEYEILSDPATGDDFAQSEWLDLCARAGTDHAARKIVTRLFRDKESV